MAKEWILNSATNRWGLNKKKYVGPVAMWIRECDPKSLIDWQDFYYQKLSEYLNQKKINLTPAEYIEDLGKKLFVKISEIIRSEIEEVTEEDCIDYIKNLILQRTFDGYKNEIQTVYGYLEKRLGIKIKPAPDDWDRHYNIDFYFNLKNKIIGLQIKPLTYEQLPQVYKWKEWLERSHEKFKKDHNGEVFIIFTTTKEGKKVIYNTEAINKLKKLVV